MLGLQSLYGRQGVENSRGQGAHRIAAQDSAMFHPNQSVDRRQLTYFVGFSSPLLTTPSMRSASQKHREIGPSNRLTPSSCSLSHTRSHTKASHSFVAVSYCWPSPPPSPPGKQINKCQQWMEPESRETSACSRTIIGNGNPRRTVR